MSKIIYLVTSGEYSDFGIDGVFDSKELAELFITMFESTWRTFRIEEHEVNPKEGWIRKEMKVWEVFMNKNGEVTDIEVGGSSYLFDYIKEDGRYYHINTHRITGAQSLVVYCFAKDKEHAIKIANEIRVKSIANNEWVATNKKEN